MKLKGQPSSRRRSQALARADLLATASVALLLVTVFILFQRRVQAISRMKLCEDNLRQIGGAVARFAAEHDSKLPGTLRSSEGDSWWWYKEEVKRYLGLSGPSSESDRAFACPLDRGYSDPGPFFKNARFDYSSYVFNGVTLPGIPNIAGWRTSAIAEPNRTLAVMEWSAHAPLSWHRSRTGKSNGPFYNDAESIVAFVDGHAEMVKIYYDGYNAAYTRDPVAGYRYRYSGR
jgi:hypothetical protein